MISCNLYNVKMFRGAGWAGKELLYWVGFVRRSPFFHHSVYLEILRVSSYNGHATNLNSYSCHIIVLYSDSCIL